MLKKSIAAALLVAIVAWAEMALAPMLAMYAGHAHPAVEIAGPVAAHHHDHVMPPGHPCCPKVSKTKVSNINIEDAIPIEFAASSLPCQDEHRCCFWQGPQSVPAPVSAGRRLGREISTVQIAEVSTAHDAETHVAPASAAAFSTPLGLFGMVLRV